MTREEKDVVKTVEKLIKEKKETLVVISDDLNFVQGTALDMAANIWGCIQKVADREVGFKMAMASVCDMFLEDIKKENTDVSNEIKKMLLKAEKEREENGKNNSRKNKKNN